MTVNRFSTLLLAALLSGSAVAVCAAEAVPDTAPASAASVASTAAAAAPATETPAAPVATAPAPRAATAPVTPQLPGQVSPAPSAGSLLQTIVGLCVVLGLLAGLAWFLKRFGPRQGGANAHLRVVGALNLGGRERVIVVEVGDQWIVVGASPGRVNALATMPRQKDAPGPAVLDTYSPSASSFSEWLKQTIDKRK